MGRNFKTVSVDDSGLVARGGIYSFYATMSSDAETTLYDGSTGEYLDLVYLIGANQSDGAVTVDIASGTGGSPSITLEIPANATAGFTGTAPFPMNETGQPWVVSFADSDTTGTTVDFSGLLRREQ